MKYLKILIVFLFTIFTIFACSNNKPAKGVAIAGNKSYEASLFRQNCAICHGAEAEGKQMEERLVPSLRRGDVETKNEQEIYNQIANGGNGMTPFRNQLTETELRKMVNFVKYDLQKKN
jgi:mono/diheme cytochrome c family protein